MPCPSMEAAPEMAAAAGRMLAVRTIMTFSIVAQSRRRLKRGGGRRRAAPGARAAGGDGRATVGVRPSRRKPRSRLGSDPGAPLRGRGGSTEGAMGAAGYQSFLQTSFLQTVRKPIAV
jgi:hypothetical protein